MQSKKSTSKDKIRERQKNKSNRKRKTNSVSLCLILPKCAGSVNCTRADRVTSQYISGALPVSLNVKGSAVFP